MKIKILTSMIAIAFADAAVADNTTYEQDLPTVVVTADRYEQTLDKTAPNVAVVTRKHLNRTAAKNLDDITLYEAGVNVSSDNARRGHSSINIRGIGDNRVLMMVDGIRIPEAYTSGGTNGTISGRDLVEPDTLKQVDIVKGPYSAFYGSDAVGGVVNMNTYSPSNFVNANKPFAAGLKYGYRSRDKSYGVTGMLAGYHENAEGLIMLTKRQGHETKNRGDDKSFSVNRTASNPQNIRSHNILIKGNAGNDAHRLEALYEQFYRHTQTNLANDLGSRTMYGFTTTTSRSEADDNARRQRMELGYRYYGSGSLKNAYIGVYQQKLDSQDNAVNTSIMRGRGPAIGSTRYSDYSFHQKIQGINSNATWEIDSGSLKHIVNAGAEYRQTDTERPRDSTTIDSRGNVSKTYAGSLYPNKTFPDSRRKTFSLYAQDSLKFDNGLTLTPALRYETETLNPKADRAYLNANPNGDVTSFKDHAFSPSLRLSMPFTNKWTGFATYSRGFRTPPFDTATMAFINTTHGYAIKPNNNLKSETSDSIELGLKFRDDRTKAQVTTFYNRYKNFINRTQIRTDRLANGRPLLVYQYQNLDEAKTYGIEAGLSYQLTPNWRASGNIAWMHGENGKKQPLDTAYPLNGVLGIDYQQTKWGVGSNFRWSKAQKRVSSDNIFKPAGYGVWDAHAWYRPNKQWEMSLNVYNLGNKKYWQHADVAGLDTTAIPNMDLYTASGRNIAASVSFKF